MRAAGAGERADPGAEHLGGRTAGKGDLDEVTASRGPNRPREPPVRGERKCAVSRAGGALRGPAGPPRPVGQPGAQHLDEPVAQPQHLAAARPLLRGLVEGRAGHDRRALADVLGQVGLRQPGQHLGHHRAHQRPLRHGLGRAPEVPRRGPLLGKAITAQQLGPLVPDPVLARASGTEPRTARTRLPRVRLDPPRELVEQLAVLVVVLRVNHRFSLAFRRGRLPRAVHQGA